MSKCAPRYNQSDPTRDIKMFIALQQERSDTHKTLRSPRKLNIEISNLCETSVSATFLSKIEPEVSEVLHLPHGIISTSKIENDDSFTRRDSFDTSKFTKYCTCHAEWAPQAPLILTHACQRLSNVQKVPRLPRGWKGDQRPAPVRQSNVLDFRTQNVPQVPRLPPKMDLAPKTSTARW